MPATKLRSADWASERWIDELCSWGERDQQALWARGKHLNSTQLLEEGSLGLGYKCFIWHQKADGSQPSFSGHSGQMVIVDMPSETVLVTTAVSDELPGHYAQLRAVLQAAINHRR